jgi:hypothetical protein
MLNVTVQAAIDLDAYNIANIVIDRCIELRA